MKPPVTGRDHLEDSYQALATKHSDGRLQESMKVICFVGAIAHISFLFLFAILGAFVMAGLNVISIGIWIFAFYLAHKQRYQSSINLIIGEMFAHAVFATYLVGPNLGFQYYLWPLMGLLLALPSHKLKQSTFICVLVIISFIALSLFTRDIHYNYELSHIVDYVYSANIFLAAMPFVLTILYLRSTNTDNEKALFSQANMDALTETYNRRFVHDLMENTGNEQRRRSFDTYSLVLGDIDNFALINESLGHGVADAVIKKIAVVLKDSVRDSDIVSRWGAEEFLIILANADSDTTEKVVHKMRHGIYSNIEIPEVNEIGLSMSFGIASAHRHMSFEETLRQADLKLYQAKASGSDRIIV
jgi:diguanylate cyclase (GGDEF)-like protein